MTSQATESSGGSCLDLVAGAAVTDFTAAGRSVCEGDESWSS